MSYSKIKNFAAIGLCTAVAGSFYFVDYNNVVKNICNDKYKITVPPGKWNNNWDHRDPNSSQNKVVSSNSTDLEKPVKKENKIKATRHFLLIRHGQYNLQGKTDSERYLTELGRIQAEATGLRLAELASLIPYTSIVRSTMKRAQETSKLIESHLPPLPVTDEPLLEEGCPFIPEPPLNSSSIEKAYYKDGPRIEAAFRKYFHRASSSDEKDSYTIMVCHANVIRYFICRALQFPSEGWLRMSLNHASITMLSIYPNGRVTLRAVGDTGHMLSEWISR